MRNVDFIIRLMDAEGMPKDVTKMVNFYRIFDHNLTHGLSTRASMREAQRLASARRTRR